jgi:hypothetical protein
VRVARAPSTAQVIGDALGGQLKIEETIQRFREAVLKKGEFAPSAADDHRLHGEMATAWRELQSQGIAGRDAFKGLLTDESCDVRGWVAAQLLSEGDRDALSVLEELSRSQGADGFSARMTLKEWRAKRLSSPFSD